MASRSCDPLELRKMLVSDCVTVFMHLYSAGAAVTPEAESLHPQPSACASTTVGSLGKICSTQLTQLEIATEKREHCCYWGQGYIIGGVELRLVMQKCVPYFFDQSPLSNSSCAIGNSE